MRPLCFPPVPRWAGRASRGATLLCLALASATCAARVTLIPADDAWEPRESGARALLRSGGAEVQVDIAAAGGPFPLRGEIRNRGAVPLHVAFVPERAPPGDAVIGETSGEGPREPLRAGGGFDLPSAGVRAFRLRSDEPWPAAGLPRVGATLSHLVLVRSDAGETQIPLRFRVRSGIRLNGFGIERSAEAAP